MHLFVISNVMLRIYRCSIWGMFVAMLTDYQICFLRNYFFSHGLTNNKIAVAEGLFRLVSF